MFDLFLGELLLPPKRVQQLTWDEAESIICGYRVRLQQEMLGHRLVATQVYNLSPDKKGPRTPEQFYSLPLVDRVSPPSNRVNPGWKERMKHKYGDKLEA